MALFRFLSINLVFTHTKQKQTNTTQEATSLKCQSLPLGSEKEFPIGRSVKGLELELPRSCSVFLIFVFVALNKKNTENSRVTSQRLQRAIEISELLRCSKARVTLLFLNLK